MGLFSRRGQDDGPDHGEDIDRVKLAGSELLRIKDAHRTLSCPPAAKSPTASGPSCATASTPQKKGWFSR
ncbi:hypothetical protein ABT354_26525 [Streptomyces sp. NPDC000594]|uniref:hypothetical protein n=1 Tax=Streptomyces sp. NPDC000594 TaxID=3154261 RepID=UPI0033321718